ncbi:unnamed protein product [Amoebophrya sp. A120]|nr:unnamed protein product [Amoebophrya sp. A120]|eukprot:GSA120T00017884001.1
MTRNETNDGEDFEFYHHDAEIKMDDEKEEDGEKADEESEGTTSGPAPKNTVTVIDAAANLLCLVSRPGDGPCALLVGEIRKRVAAVKNLLPQHIGLVDSETGESYSDDEEVYIAGEKGEPSQLGGSGRTTNVLVASKEPLLPDPLLGTCSGKTKTSIDGGGQLLAGRGPGSDESESVGRNDGVSSSIDDQECHDEQVTSSMTSKRRCLEKPSENEHEEKIETSTDDVNKDKEADADPPHEGEEQVEEEQEKNACPPPAGQQISVAEPGTSTPTEKKKSRTVHAIVKQPKVDAWEAAKNLVCTTKEDANFDVEDWGEAAVLEFAAEHEDAAPLDDLETMMALTESVFTEMYLAEADEARLSAIVWWIYWKSGAKVRDSIKFVEHISQFQIYGVDAGWFGNWFEDNAEFRDSEKLATLAVRYFDAKYVSVISHRLSEVEEGNPNIILELVAAVKDSESLYFLLTAIPYFFCYERSEAPRKHLMLEAIKSFKRGKPVSEPKLTPKLMDEIKDTLFTSDSYEEDDWQSESRVDVDCVFAYLSICSLCCPSFEEAFEMVSEERIADKNFVMDHLLEVFRRNRPEMVEEFLRTSPGTKFRRDLDFMSELLSNNSEHGGDCLQYASVVLRRDETLWLLAWRSQMLAISRNPRRILFAQPSQMRTGTKVLLRPENRRFTADAEAVQTEARTLSLLQTGLCCSRSSTSTEDEQKRTAVLYDETYALCPLLFSSQRPFLPLLHECTPAMKMSKHDKSKAKGHEHDLWLSSRVDRAVRMFGAVARIALAAGLSGNDLGDYLTGFCCVNSSSHYCANCPFHRRTDLLLQDAACVRNMKAVSELYRKYTTTSCSEASSPSSTSSTATSASATHLCCCVVPKALQLPPENEWMSEEIEIQSGEVDQKEQVEPDTQAGSTAAQSMKDVGGGSPAVEGCGTTGVANANVVSATLTPSVRFANALAHGGWDLARKIILGEISVPVDGVQHQVVTQDEIASQCATAGHLLSLKKYIADTHKNSTASSPLGKSTMDELFRVWCRGNGPGLLRPVEHIAPSAVEESLATSSCPMSSTSSTAAGVGHADQATISARALSTLQQDNNFLFDLVYGGCPLSELAECLIPEWRSSCLKFAVDAASVFGFSAFTYFSQDLRWRPEVLAAAAKPNKLFSDRDKHCPHRRNIYDKCKSASRKWLAQNISKILVVLRDQMDAIASKEVLVALAAEIPYQLWAALPVAWRRSCPDSVAKKFLQATIDESPDRLVRFWKTLSPAQRADASFLQSVFAARFWDRHTDCNYTSGHGDDLLPFFHYLKPDAKLHVLLSSPYWCTMLLCRNLGEGGFGLGVVPPSQLFELSFWLAVVRGASTLLSERPHGRWLDSERAQFCGPPWSLRRDPNFVDAVARISPSIAVALASSEVLACKSMMMNLIRRLDVVVGEVEDADKSRQKSYRVERDIERLLCNTSRAVCEDANIVTEAARRNGIRAIRAASRDLRSRKDIAMLAVQQSGLALQHLPPKLSADEDVCLAAVSQNGLALEFCSMKMRSQSRSIVLAAVKQNPRAIFFARGERFLGVSDPEAFSAACKCREYVMYLAGFCLSVPRSHPLASRRVDFLRELILAKAADVSCLSGMAGLFTGEDVSESGDDPLCRTFLYKRDEAMRLVREISGEALAYLPIQLRGELDIAKAAVGNTGKALRYVCPTLLRSTEHGKQLTLAALRSQKNRAAAIPAVPMSLLRDDAEVSAAIQEIIAESEIDNANGAPGSGNNRSTWKPLPVTVDDFATISLEGVEQQIVINEETTDDEDKSDEDEDEMAGEEAEQM